MNPLPAAILERCEKTLITTMIKYIFILLSLNSALISKGQSISPDGQSYGFIVFDNDIYSGTGFVVNNKREVITCAHVIDTTKNIFYVTGAITHHGLIKQKLKVVKILPAYDLALLQSDVDLCTRPFISENAFHFFPNQHLFYLGYNFTKSNDTVKSIQANNANISSLGKTFQGKTPVDFIEFVGVGIPGYSGGPVINDQGKIVGIMSQAWLRRGIKGGQTLIVNRAFSILPILKYQ